MTLGLFTSVRIKLRAETRCAKTARTTGKREVLLTLARKFPDSREVQSAVFTNPLAQKDPEILAKVQVLCQDKMRHLPYVKELLRKARNPQVTDAELKELVVHPLAMVREITFNNSAILGFAKRTESPRALHAMARNELGSHALAVKRIIIKKDVLPADDLRLLMSDSRISL